MTRKILTVLALCFCTTIAAHSQVPPGRDPIGEALIPPDVVMGHQQALGLSDAQKNAIQIDMQNAQQRFTQLQWQLAGATEKLLKILKQNHVDQAKALSQLDTELNLEREIKHAQLTLMIQIKNELTSQQQAMARRFAGKS